VSGGRRPSGWTAPLGLQVLVLVFASVVFGQALAVLIVAVSPPPHLAPVLIEDLAEAFAGHPLPNIAGRRLTREVLPAGAVAPKQTDVSPPALWRRAMLAKLLGAAPAAVVLDETRPSPFDRFMTGGMGPPHGPPPGQGPGRGPGPVAYPGPGPVFAFGGGPGPDFVINGGPGPAQGAGPRPPPPDGPFRHVRAVFGPFIFDNFTAAYTRPDGRVVVVRASQAWPTPWQLGMIAWLIGAALVMAPVCLWFSRRITAPLDEFAAAAQRLGRDPSAPPMPAAGPREIRRAALAFNDMQLRVRRYVEDRTGMVGAISHDLRTPLARIRFKLEARTPDKASIRADLAQMETMITHVLAFLRDAAEPKVRERINLLSLVETAIDDAAGLNAPVALLEADDPLVEGDVQALQRALSNLIDNAVKYGGRAAVSVKAAGDDAIVEIEDDGPGLPPSERETVFKPFHRTDAARRLDDAGVGLGLSVSRSIARAHGGDVTLDVRARGLVATLRLPIVEGG
jgi:signal transduction histidine kinase